MPNAPLHPCSESGCSVLLARGARCPAHSRQKEQARGSASQRGYNVAWVRFREAFIAMLVEHGIPPTCGAALPQGPQTQDSECKRDGYLTFDGLHLDHEPPLTEAERSQPAIVCDPFRVQLLCGHRCHAAKTRRQALTRGRYQNV